MEVLLHPHAAQRLEERGATAVEVQETVLYGERFVAKLGRQGFRRNFAYGGIRNGKFYENKQVEAYAVMEDGAWLVITVLAKFF